MLAWETFPCYSGKVTSCISSVTTCFNWVLPAMRRFLSILLAPVARFCVRHGVLLPEVIDALKMALLEAGVDHLKHSGERVTTSRLSVMTGVHRKDGSKFLKGITPQRDTISPSIKVLGCWHTKKRYLQPDGKPRTLSVGSEESEFASLVRSVIADIHPHSILCELERLELVKVVNNEVAPLKSTFISAMDDENTARIIARDVGELLSTAEENVCAKGPPPHHHTTTSFDNIPLEFEAELRKWINQESGALHMKIRDHVAQYDRDLSERSLAEYKNGTVRFTFGSFGRICTVEDNQDETE